MVISASLGSWRDGRFGNARRPRGPRDQGPEVGPGGPRPGLVGTGRGGPADSGRSSDRPGHGSVEGHRGRPSARKLAAAGATVLLVARSTEGLEEVRRAIVADGGLCAVTYPGRSADLAAVAQLVDRLRSDHGPVDVVVSNAGKSIRRSVAESYGRLHDVTRTTNVNYVGPVQLLLGLLPGMRARGIGHVVSVGTVSTDLPAPYWAAYTGSKSAFEAGCGVSPPRSGPTEW